ncbi:AAA domain-containing protein [Entophlyctis helioformis]|nr:AAA domain-containing protein [Entophlyctis helioformis]
MAVQKRSRLALHEPLFLGIVLLCFHPDTGVRVWAQTSIQNAHTPIDVSKMSALNQILADVFEQLRSIYGTKLRFPDRAPLWPISSNEDHLWSGLVCVCSNIRLDSAKVLLDAVVPDADRLLVVAFTRTNAPSQQCFWDRLRFFNLVCNATDCAWLSSTSCTVDMRETVFRSIAFSDAVKDACSATAHSAPLAGVPFAASADKRTDTDETLGRVHAFCQWLAVFLMRTPRVARSLSEPDQGIQQHAAVSYAWVSDHVRMLTRKASSDWSPPSKDALAAPLLELMDSFLSTTGLTDAVLGFLLRENSPKIESELLDFVISCIHADVSVVEWLESETAALSAPDQRIQTHDSICPSALNTIIPQLLPLSFTSAINSGAISASNPATDPGQDIADAPFNVLLAEGTRSILILASECAPLSLGIDTMLQLLIFNDRDVQACAERIFASSSKSLSLEDAIVAHARSDVQGFFSKLFSVLALFKQSCAVPTDCLVSSHGVLRLLSGLRTVVFGPAPSVASKGSAANGMHTGRLYPLQTEDAHLRFWLHSFLAIYAILNAAVHWAKQSRHHSREIKQLVSQTVGLLRSFFSVHPLLINDSNRHEVASDWCHETVQALLPWTKTTDVDLGRQSLSLVIDMLELASSVDAVFDPTIARRVYGLGSLSHHMDESQSMIFALWVSQQERLQQHAAEQRQFEQSYHDQQQQQQQQQHHSLHLPDAIPMPNQPPRLDPAAFLSGHRDHAAGGQANSWGNLDNDDLALTSSASPDAPCPTHGTAANIAAPDSASSTALHTPLPPKPRPIGAPTIPSRIAFASGKATLIGSVAKPSAAARKATGYASTGKVSKLAQLRAEVAQETRRTAVMRPIMPRRQPTSGDSVTTTELRSGPVGTAAGTRPVQDREKSPEPEHRTIKLIDVGVKPSSTRQGRLIQTSATMGSEPKPIGYIKDLFRAVLSWDMDSSTSKRPPHLISTKLDKVADTFDNAKDYARTFEPLLVMECWEQFVQAREQLNTGDSIATLLSTITMVDDMHEITFTASPNDVKLQQWAEHAVLALREPAANVSLLGRVVSIGYKGGESVIVCSAYLKNRPKVVPHLRLSSKWLALQVFSLVTTLREYQSILSLPTIPLSREILQPIQSKPPAPDKSKVAEYQRTLKVNVPQATAIAAAIEQRSGFVLIQGPPGTGKTKTILGLIGALQRTSTPISIPGASTSGPTAIGLNAIGNHGFANGQRGLMQPSLASLPSPSKRRLLCCAPSNAAIDEIVRRLKEGILNAKGQMFQPKIPQRASTRDGPVKSRAGESESLGTDAANADQDFTRRFQEIGARLAALHKLVGEESSAKDESSADLDRAKRNLRVKILAEADVVLTTLSGAGHDLFADTKNASLRRYDEVVIIDEACQSVELSCLIPLRYGATKCIMVGDPNQLPPTVVSQLAQDYSYEQSLFQRLMKSCKESIHLLSIQYRMHPHISQFPSEYFYNSELKDADGLDKTCAAVWHNTQLFAPYRLLDLHQGREQTGYGKSLFNTEEALACVLLVKKLCAAFPNLQFGSRIGIITFYKLQVRKLKDVFVAHFGRAILDAIDINTVDGFQGQEKDIIILSCVRASKDRGVGFISDVRRMNVALTRARHSLIILGNVASLGTNLVWRELINNAKDRNMCLKITSGDLHVSGKHDFTNLVGPDAGQSSSKENKNSAREPPKTRNKQIGNDGEDRTGRSRQGDGGNAGSNGNENRSRNSDRHASGSRGRQDRSASRARASREAAPQRERTKTVTAANRTQRQAQRPRRTAWLRNTTREIRNGQDRTSDLMLAQRQQC